MEASFCSKCGADVDASSSMKDTSETIRPAHNEENRSIDTTGWVIIIALVALVGWILVGFIQASVTQEAEPTYEIRPVEGPCENIFARASLTDDPSDAEVLLVDTLRKCDSIDEWWAAAERFPTAFAGYDLLGTELDLMCDRYSDVGICRTR